MTELDSHAPGRTSLPMRDHPFNTLYRDTPLTNPVVKRAIRPLPMGSYLEVPEGEHLSDGILIALAAATLPAVVYSFAQMWSLLAGGALTQAIRAFFP